MEESKIPDVVPLDPEALKTENVEIYDPSHFKSKYEEMMAPWINSAAICKTLESGKCCTICWQKNETIKTMIQLCIDLMDRCQYVFCPEHKQERIELDKALEQALASSGSAGDPLDASLLDTEEAKKYGTRYDF